MTNGGKASHSLRIGTFLLRVVLGANFFYVGFASLFDPALAKELSSRSIGSLAAATGAPELVGWVLMITGACLILGFATRFACAAGIAFSVAAYLKSGALASGLAAAASTDLLIAVSLAVVFLADAGSYIGLDKFIHIHLGGHKK